jgi:hemoglobin
MQAAQAKVPTSPYEAIGGADTIRAIVERFYDLMESDPAYEKLRGLHAPDLGPMRKSLAGFLIAWSGGPRTWFEERPGACVMSAHRDVDVDVEVRDQWVHAMERAAQDHLDPRFAEAMMEALGRMASAMVQQ